MDDQIDGSDRLPLSGRSPIPAAAPAPPGFRHHFSQIRGTRLHYVRGGSGEPLVLLHGFPNTWYAWRDVMIALRDRYTVIAVDLRGLGDSTPPGHGYDVPSTAADVAELVDSLGFEWVHLAGQDWGGSVAFAYAAEHSAQVRRLAVIEAMPAGPWTDAAGGASAWFAEFHRIPDLPEQLVTGREAEYLAWFSTAFSATPGIPDTTAIAEYLRTYRQPGAMTAAFERYRQTELEVEHNARFTIEPIDVPILAVGGQRVFGPQVAENLERGAAADVQTLVLEGCGHFVSEERPTELARAFADFFI